MSKRPHLKYTAPSFAEGVSRIVDFGGTLQECYLLASPKLYKGARRNIFFANRRTETGAVKPVAATLAADWDLVGRDLGTATKRLVSEHRKRVGSSAVMH